MSDVPRGAGPLRRAGLPALRAGASALLLAGAWEGYKALGLVDGVSIGGTRVLPRGDDVSMPHLWTILARLGGPEVSTGATAHTVAETVGRAMLVSGGIALVGLTLGALVGLVLGVLLQAAPVIEEAVLPYVVVSQTVPLVAIAPLVVGWGGHLLILGRPWQPWMSVAMISAYLAFFPVAVGALRGLHSPTAVQHELLRSRSAHRWQVLVHLSLPSAVPHLLPALRLAAASSVVGAVVAEISTGTRGGVGRLIIEYAQAASGDPAKPYAAILGASLLGLLMAGVVALLELALHRYRGGTPADD